MFPPYRRLFPLLLLLSTTAIARGPTAPLPPPAPGTATPVQAVTPADDALYKALYPSLISLNLTQATSTEVAAAINTALGDGKSWVYSPGSAPVRFTLTLDHQPLAAVMAELSRQHPIFFPARPDHRPNHPQLVFDAEAGPAPHPLVVSGPFAITLAVDEMPLTPQGRFAGPRPTFPPRWRFQFTGISDPRVKVVDRTPRLLLTAALDDAGNDLRQTLEPDTGIGRTSSIDTTFRVAAVVRTPEKPGKRISHVAGALQLQVEVAPDRRPWLDVPFEFRDLPVRLLPPPPGLPPARGETQPG